MKKRTLATGLTLLLAAALPPASAEEFTFDASEFEKKTFEFSGYLEQKGEVLKLRGDSPAYRLAYPGKSSRSTLLRSTTTLETSGKLSETSAFDQIADAMAKNAEQPVLIAANKNLKYEVVVHMMDTLRKQNVKNVSLFVQSTGK